jgi:hypothetical protein
MLNITLPGPPGIAVYQDHYRGHYKKKNRHLYNDSIKIQTPRSRWCSLTKGGSKHQSGKWCSRKEDQKRNRQAVFWKWGRENGWQGRELKLKELKQEEGHIALGKWNSQWSHMQPYVGWTLLFASVTCLQGHIRWDLFVLGAQPLDTSPLSLCQDNKMLLPSKLPQCPTSQFEIPIILLSRGVWYNVMTSD